MEEKVFRMLYDYSKNKKIIDTQFIDYFFEEYQKENETKNYLEEIVIDKTDDSLVGGLYSTVDKKITLYTDTIVDYYYREEIDFCFFDTKEYLFLNLYILESLFHELEHVKQEKLLNEKANQSLEKTIMYYGNAFSDARRIRDVFFERKIKGIKRIHSLYNSTYNYNPAEHSSDVLAFKKILNLIENDIKANDKLIKYFRLKLLLSESKGYEINNKKIIPPTGVYLKNIKCTDVWHNLGFEKNDYDKVESEIIRDYSKEERFRLGLSISEEEYKENKDKILLLRKEL